MHEGPGGLAVESVQERERIEALNGVRQIEPCKSVSGGIPARKRGLDAHQSHQAGRGRPRGDGECEGARPRHVVTDPAARPGRRAWWTLDQLIPRLLQSETP